MRFTFRVDASLQIGTGHVMRCLTLADELRQRGAGSDFLCRDEPGNLTSFIGSRGYRTTSLAATNGTQRGDAALCAPHLAETRSDWIVVDHYGLGREWEQAARQFARRIFVIDDLADRAHDCDLLLDQNLYDGVDERYTPLLSEQCRQLIGPRFAVLRPEFAALRRKVSRASGPISRLLVNFGGADNTNETTRVLGLLQDVLPPSVSIDVVLGSTNPHADHIRTMSFADRPVAVHVAADRMAELMSQADAFVGAGGSTTWERFCLGLPSLVVAVAENQIPTAQYLGKRGAIDYIGTASTLTADAIRASLSRFLMDHEARATMAERGMQLVDGRGVERVGDCLLASGKA